MGSATHHSTSFIITFSTVTPPSSILTNGTPYIGLADAINAAFRPPAVYAYRLGAYVTACDAVAPQLAVRVGGASMPINPRDLVFRDFVDPISGMCMTGVASGGIGPFILGSVFLQNVLTVFDVGNAEMRFLSRPYY